MFVHKWLIILILSKGVETAYRGLRRLKEIEMGVGTEDKNGKNRVGGSQLYIIQRFIYEEADMPHPLFCILFFLSSNRASRCFHSSTYRFMSLLVMIGILLGGLYHLTSAVVVDGHLGCLFDAHVQEKFLLTLLLTFIRVFFSNLQ